VEGKVNNLSFYVKPDAQFIPPHELKVDQKILKGFDWRGDKKPKRKDVVKSGKSPTEPTPLPIKKAVQ
jgi:hypothetical protein